MAISSLKKILFFCLAFFAASGCTKTVMRASSSILPRFGQAVMEECDPLLAEQAMPANLKLLEGLLKSDPQNPALLHSLCMGFCGYSLLFVEENDPPRAAQLYLRARDYGLEALGRNAKRLADLRTHPGEIRTILAGLDRDQIDILVWTAAAWANWINLNLDQPEALAQLGVLENCLRRILELDNQYLYGLPDVLLGAFLAGRPALLGGNLAEARNHFEKALALNQGRFLIVNYYFARYYAVHAQDRELFKQLIQAAAEADPEDIKPMCLVNVVFQRKTLALKKQMDELFF